MSASEKKRPRYGEAADVFVTIRMPRSLRELVRQEALQEGRTICGQVVWLLRKHYGWKPQIGEVTIPTKRKLQGLGGIV